LLSALSPLEAAKVAAFQLRCIGLLMSGGMTMREEFRALGMVQRELAGRTMRLQDEIVRDMLAGGGTENRRDAVRGLLNPAQGFGPKILDFLHPQGGVENAPAWHRAVLEVWTRSARFADRALA